MITVGDLCLIDRMSEVKADALDIVDKWHNAFTSPYTDSVYELYKPGKLPGESDGGFNYTVEGIVNKDGTLYAICYAHGVDTVYVTTLDNLSVCLRDHKPFKVGQLVTVTRPLQVYSSWKTLIDSLDGQIENYQDVCSRWVNGRLADGGGVYKVVYIGRNIARPEDSWTAIIDDGSKAFIINADGLAKTYAWEEYLQYLRNWATKYTEYTPGHSPKSYEDWVKARNGDM
jgi:hypothetical protein